MAQLLIVDDDLSILELMKQSLIDAGYDVESATCGKEALTKLSEQAFDLLLTDILMPDICGLHVIDKAIELNVNITILAISGGGLDKDGGDLLDKALSSGADAVLQKPFNPGELIRTVNALMR